MIPPRPLPDPEWTALAAGLKPALRLALDPAQAPAEAARLGALGLAVALAEAPVRLGGRDRRLLYAARSAAAAGALRDAEAATLPELAPGASAAAQADGHRRLGRLLGYPGCCVEAFVARIARLDGPDRLRVHEDFLHASAALAATAGPPRARLNVHRSGPRARLVAWYPCRYDCAPSLRLADALHAELARLAPAAAAALDDALVETVVLRPDGSRAPSPPPGDVVVLRFCR